MGSSLWVQDQMDSIRWWAGSEDSTAESTGVQRQMSGSDGSEMTSEDDGSGLRFEASSDSCLELSDLGTRDSQTADYQSQSQSPTGRWNENSEEEWHFHDVETVRQERSETTQRLRQRRDRDWSSPGREWVARRRSDGSCYIRRRRDQDERRRRPVDNQPVRVHRQSAGSYDCHHRSVDSSQRRSTSHQSAGSYDHQHGCTTDNCSYDVEQKTGDVIHTLTSLDQRTPVDHEDYNTVEWICGPHWTDSSCRIIAVV